MCQRSSDSMKCLLRKDFRRTGQACLAMQHHCPTERQPSGCLRTRQWAWLANTNCPARNAGKNPSQAGYIAQLHRDRGSAPNFGGGKRTGHEVGPQSAETVPGASVKIDEIKLRRSEEGGVDAVEVAASGIEDVEE